MEDPKTYEPCVSQRQSDMMQHAAHNPLYALSRHVPEDVAQGKHAADVKAAKWGKSEDGPCPKCLPDCEHPEDERTLDGYCSACGLHESLIEAQA